MDNLIDISALISVVGNNPQTHKRLLHKFISVTPASIFEIQRAFKNGDAKEVGQLGHKVKSSARTMGAHRLADICEQLEEAGKEGNLEPVVEHVNELEGLMQAIDQHVKSNWPA